MRQNRLDIFSNWLLEYFMSDLIKGIDERLSEFDPRLFAASQDKLSRKTKASVLRAAQHPLIRPWEPFEGHNAYVRLSPHTTSLYYHFKYH